MLTDGQTHFTVVTHSMQHQYTVVLIHISKIKYAANVVMLLVSNYSCLQLQRLLHSHAMMTFDWPAAAIQSLDNVLHY